MQLISLLNDYPGGISTAVLETHLWAQGSQNSKVQYHAGGSSDITTLSQILKATSDQQPSSVLHLTVVGVQQGSDDGSTAPTAAAAAAASQSAAQPCAQQQAVPLLLLHDASLQDGSQSVQHYVHSTLRSLFSGPNARLGRGCQLRLGNCRLRRAPKASGLPPRLLPTAEAVIVFDNLATTAQLSAGPLFHLSQVLGSAKVQPDQQLCLEGLLAAAIARIDPLAVGWAHPGSRSSRTGRCRSIWLANVHAPGGGLTELRLFDDRVAIAELLRVGEHLAVLRPVLTGAPSGLIVEMARDSVVCAAGRTTATQSSQPVTQGPGSRRTVIADLAPGAQQALLLARLTSLTFARLNTGRIVADLGLQDPTGLLHLRMLFMDTPTQTALSMRPGYSIAVSGVAVPEQEAAHGSPLQAEWVEGADGATLRNLTAMRGALSSPALHTNLLALAQAAAPAAQLSSLLLCRARIAREPTLQWQRLHSCGRALTDQMHLADGPRAHTSQDGKERLVCCMALRRAADVGRRPRQLDHDQWGCGFCGETCCRHTSAMEAVATLRLTDGSATTDVEAQATAVAPLLGGTSPQEFHHWAAERQAEHLASLAGTSVLASLYHLPDSAGGVTAGLAGGNRLGCAVLRVEAEAAC